MSNTVRAAVVGAAGYTGEELLRLLIGHPNVEIGGITSREHAGRSISQLFGWSSSELEFVQPDVAMIADCSDVAFLALPHGLAAEFAAPLLERGVKVIDLSADFRLRDTTAFQRYYGNEHPAPELLKSAVYGLPERYRSEIATASLIACPGCYPTSIILGVAPLLVGELASTQRIAACSMSGVSGAGKKADVAYLFAECNENIRPYAPIGHRHLPEIEQELAIAASVDDLRISFIPHLAPITRGIHSTITLDALSSSLDDDALFAVLMATYDDEPFVRVLEPGTLAAVTNVARTNYCDIAFVVDHRMQRIILSVAIDNLTKGAAGQAVQCMNIMYGLDETSGLL